MEANIKRSVSLKTLIHVLNDFFKLQKLLVVFLVLLLSNCAMAQISFIDSAYKTLNSDQELLYEETKITFNTGIYRSTDYRFEKISDSICTDWIVTACFNAECWNELLDSGHFIDDYNPDSNSCFIAFHVFSLGKDGRSKIRYRVINELDSSDRAVLTWDVSYHNPLSLNSAGIGQFSVWPNPSNKIWTISLSEDIPTDVMMLYDSQGRRVMAEVQFSFKKIEVNALDLSDGIYTLVIPLKSGSRNIRLIKTGLL